MDPSSHSAQLVSLPVWSDGSGRQYSLVVRLRVIGHPIIACGLVLNPLRSHQLSDTELPRGSIDPIDPLVVIRGKPQFDQ